MLEALDAVVPPKRPINKPLRVPIQDVYKVGGVGTVVVGRVETGVIRVGTTVTVAPVGLITEVKSIEMHREPCRDPAEAGEYVGFNLMNVQKTDFRHGFIAGDCKHNPSVKCDNFVGQVIVHE